MITCVIISLASGEESRAVDQVTPKIFLAMASVQRMMDETGDGHFEFYSCTLEHALTNYGINSVDVEQDILEWMALYAGFDSDDGITRFIQFINDCDS